MDKTTGVDYRKEKNPAEIRSEIEETRAQLGETVEEIKERFSSEQNEVAGEGSGDRARQRRDGRRPPGRRADLSASAVETVRRDPLPYLSIGAGFGIGIGGLIWLLRKRNGNGYSRSMALLPGNSNIRRKVIPGLKARKKNPGR